MGAIQKEGYTFAVEYSVMLQKASVQVYQDGDFVKEIPFEFSGQEPDPEHIEQVVDQFLEKQEEIKDKY